MKAALSDYKRNNRIDLGDFREWGRASRVFQLQDAFLTVFKEAQRNGRSLMEELKFRRYEDATDFSRSCQQFSLCCPDTDLAELGVGFTMYFQELRFLVCILLLLAFLQLPCIGTYGSVDAVEKWWYYSDWRRTLGQNRKSPCDCLGSNATLGVGHQSSSVGATCGAWDLPFCQSGQYDKPARWCCYKWCFADVTCLGFSSDSGAGSDVFFNKSLARATSQCQQDKTILTSPYCLALENIKRQGPDDPGAVSIHFISRWMLTPGNLGPEQVGGEVSYILNVYILCAVFVTLLMTIRREYQRETKRCAERMNCWPSDFAILVRGLPPEATDESIIADFFRTNAIQNVDAEVVKVVVGWAAEEFKQKMKEKKQLKAQLHKCEDSCNAMEAASLRQRIHTITVELGQSANGSDTCLANAGQVVVVFRKQHHATACINRWDQLWAHWFYRQCDKGKCCQIGSKLPRYPATQDRCIKIERADNPGEILWEDMGQPWSARAKTFLTTNVMMFLVVAVGFLIKWGCQRAKKLINDEIESNAHFSDRQLQVLSLVPALIAPVISFVLNYLSYHFGKLEHYDTVTTREFSQAAKLAVAMITNTAGIMLWHSLQPKDWYRNGGLVDDLLYMMIMDGVGRAFFLVDVTYILNWRVRRRLTQTKMDAWNKSLARCLDASSSVSEEFRDATLEGVKEEVQRFKTVFEHRTIDMPDRYARAISTFLCCTFFCPLFPGVVLLGVIGLLTQYLFDKFLLLRWFRRPQFRHEAHAVRTIGALKFFAPLSINLGFFCFLSPSWKGQGEVRQKFIISFTICVFLFLIPEAIWSRIYRSKCLRPFMRCWPQVDDDISQMCASQDYYHAQYMWPKDYLYHRTHFVYKCQSYNKNPRLLEEASRGLERKTSAKKIRQAKDCLTTPDSFGIGHPEPNPSEHAPLRLTSFTCGPAATRCDIVGVGSPVNHCMEPPKKPVGATTSVEPSEVTPGSSIATMPEGDRKASGSRTSLSRHRVKKTKNSKRGGNAFSSVCTLASAVSGTRTGTRAIEESAVVEGVLLSMSADTATTTDRECAQTDPALCDK